jgi:hypothetical protein
MNNGKLYECSYVASTDQRIHRSLLCHFQKRIYQDESIWRRGLEAPETKTGGPRRDTVERLKWWLIPDELCDEEGRALHCSHGTLDKKSIRQCGPGPACLAGFDGSLNEGHAAHAFFDAAHGFNQLCLGCIEMHDDGL